MGLQHDDLYGSLPTESILAVVLLRSGGCLAGWPWYPHSHISLTYSMQSPTGDVFL
jgi:hypothetical protein